jgi:class 3 adenylate cyclase
MQCGHPVIVATPADANRFSRITAATPEALAQKLRDASHLAGERRVVTILFVDVVGSTALSSKLDLETWTSIMNEAVDGVTPAIHRYEGTIARVLGDSLLAFFGAPVAHEDDPARAIRAALEVIELGCEYAAELKEKFNIDFAIRATINTGSVIINSVGDDLKYEFTPMGGAVNLTSRIKFAAKPMTTLISQYTYRFVEPLFDLTPLEPVEVKGRKQHIQLYRVDGIKAQPGSTRGVLGLHSPIVGRDPELNILMPLCEAVRAGLGRVVLIVGEPGLGKSRLIAEWKALVDAEGEQPAPLWVKGRGLSYGRGLAYHLLSDILRSMIGVTATAEEPEARKIVKKFLKDVFGDDSLDVYPYLGHLLSLKLDDAAQERIERLDPQAIQYQYLSAMQRLLEVLSNRQPLVMVLEDLHWADPSSVELFSRLMPLATASPMLFCLVTRAERESPGWQLVREVRELMGPSLSEISLQALTESDSRQLVDNLLGLGALPNHVQNLILKKTEGNPLFVEEVIRMLIERGAIIQKNDGWEAGKTIGDINIPDNLQGLLLARIDRLPEDVKQVLRVAAVIGRQFPVQVLEQVLSNRIAA